MKSKYEITYHIFAVLQTNSFSKHGKLREDHISWDILLKNFLIVFYFIGESKDRLRVLTINFVFHPGIHSLNFTFSFASHSSCLSVNFLFKHVAIKCYTHLIWSIILSQRIFLNIFRASVFWANQIGMRNWDYLWLYRLWSEWKFNAFDPDSYYKG